LSTIDIVFKNITKDKIQDWTFKTLREGWVLEPEQRAQLVKKVMDKLNNEVDPMLVKFRMQIRSRRSYDRHRIGMLGDIPDSVQSIEDFIDYLDK